MWLLDVNVPQQAVPILSDFGIVAQHTVSRGWNELTNGDLVEAASAQGFTCVLTRDKQFAESASRALRRFPEFAVVLMELPQLRRDEFIARFRAALSADPIRPVPGLLLRWPPAR